MKNFFLAVIVHLLMAVIIISAIVINKNYVIKNLGELVKDTDLSKFIL